MRSLALRLSPALFSVGLACRPPTPTAQPVEPDQFGPMGAPEAFLTEVPFERDLGLVIVEVQLAGLDRPSRLIIDSGAPTVLRSEVAVELGLAQMEPVTGTDPAGRAVVASPILIPSLTIGELEVTDVAAVALELPLLDGFCEPVDGLLGVGLDLGSGFLDRVAVEIDPTAKMVRLADRGKKLAAGGHRLPLRREWIEDDGEERTVTAMHVQIRVGDQPLWIKLDTGNNASTDVPHGVFRALGYTLTADNSVERFGSASASAAGRSEERTWVSRLRDVGLGDYTMATMPVSVTSNESDRSEDVLLGQDVLRHFTVVIDHPARQLRLIPAATPPAIDPEPELGFGWSVVGEQVAVISLLDKGGAARAGIQLGDEVLVAGGIDLSEHGQATVCEARAAQRDIEGPVPFRLRRDGREFEVAVQRRSPLASTPSN
ncbi:MAG: aspartyl protease family protein [Myxococcota bacterium]